MKTSLNNVLWIAIASLLVSNIVTVLVVVATRDKVDETIRIVHSENARQYELIDSTTAVIADIVELSFRNTARSNDSMFVALTEKIDAVGNRNPKTATVIETKSKAEVASVLVVDSTGIGRMEARSGNTLIVSTVDYNTDSISVSAERSDFIYVLRYKEPFDIKRPFRKRERETIVSSDSKDLNFGRVISIGNQR